MTLNRAVIMLEMYLKKYKLHKWTIVLDNAVATSGWCIKNRKTLGFSRVWIENCGEAEVRDTILHEIAHATVKETGHGSEWKAKAIELGAIPKAKVDRVTFLKLKNKIYNK